MNNNTIMKVKNVATTNYRDTITGTGSSRLPTHSLSVHTTTATTHTTTIHTPTIHTPTIHSVTVRTPTVRVPTVRVATPTVRVPTIRVPTITVRVPTVSDIRLKRDIVELGQLPSGLHLYRYRYLWSDTAYVGVMAQEVAAAMPDAVVAGEDGYLRVDYGRLGLEFLTWDEWLARHGIPRGARH